MIYANKSAFFIKKKHERTKMDSSSGLAQKLVIKLLLIIKLHDLGV
jgi:hypothetical protein